MGLEIDLGGRRALVTGVSSGIGAGIAAALARAGAAVAGCGLEPAGSAGALAFLRASMAHGQRASYMRADLADPAAPAKVVAWAAEELGGLDVVISNAGRNVFAGAAECDEDDWQANLDLNLTSHWRLAKAARPHLLAAEAPVIVIIASNHAYRTMPGCFPYNVAKAGLTAMVQSLALEWGPRVRAVGVAPGFIGTPLADAWFAGFADPAGKRAQIEAMHPAGRLGTPDDIGALCAFLCSPWPASSPAAPF